ncbi:MAG: HD domain-containing phosphohydrolase [Oscillatoria sp. PMC 1068.18]|nr:HD domain-containing phosphohydrolase [Oscillatoria sp. PMC 1076.18]MEC4989558.1 HD domain-containing phosphohydrolase [Oscillatoria sp. PMC 1068.18]
MAASNFPVIEIEGEEFSSTSDAQAELIEQLLAIGTALSGTQDLDKILQLILSKSREITSSDAGSVYLLDKTDAIPKLLFKASQNDSLCNASFREFAVPLTPKSLAGYVALTGKTLNIPDAQNLLPNLPYQLDRSFDLSFSYRTRSVLVLPMQDAEGEIIGVLQLINRKIKGDILITPENALEVTQPYSEWEERVVRSLASLTAISIERNLLQQSIENLFESFVRASVEIIERRDPTTSGHSERVAKLTVALTEEVNAVVNGNLGSIKFSDRQIQEIRYAALLHDFGKVCVPEKILNKRQKLYPEELQVIQQRFALVQRTLEKECTEKKFQYLLNNQFSQPHNLGDNCPYCQQITQLDTELADAIAKLNYFWDLLIQLNEPQALKNQELSTLSEEVFASLTTLSQYTYQDIDGKTKPLVTPAEMEQLLVPFGNLTISERAVIEAHVTYSYEFLNRIPWTKQLQNIPIIAYGHHEKLDGSGYPLGLAASEIPLQSQILTIADIYDALTASDRPYKRPLALDIVLKILYEEASKNKINLDLVQLFEQRQVYQILGH